jgi:hypothetical protein
VYLHRLRSIDVLCDCVASGPNSTTWATEGVAVAEGFDEKGGRYVGLVTQGVATGCRGTTILVHPELASTQIDLERADGAFPKGAIPLEVDAERVKATRLSRFYGVVEVDPDRLGRDGGRIAQEVVAHLSALIGTEVEVTIEVRATNAEGFPDEVVRIVSENTTSLRFRTHGFEEH